MSSPDKSMTFRNEVWSKALASTTPFMIVHFFPSPARYNIASSWRHIYRYIQRSITHEQLSTRQVNSVFGCNMLLLETLSIALSHFRCQISIFSAWSLPMQLKLEISFEFLIHQHFSSIRYSNFGNIHSATFQ